MKAESVARIFDMVGIAVKSFDEPSEMANGMVVITDTLHVGVVVGAAPYGYFYTVEQKDGLFHFGEDRFSLGGVIADVEKIQSVA